MPSQGRRMLAAAEERLAELAGATRGDDGARRVDEAQLELELEHAVAGVTHVPSWEALAREQADIDDDVLQTARDGTVFALHDRNLISMPWRQVFVIRDGDDYWVLDNQGRAIDEPHDGVRDGRQSVQSLVDEFAVNGAFFYKPGRVRRSPNPSRRPQGGVVVTPIPMSIELGISCKGVRKCCCASLILN